MLHLLQPLCIYLANVNMLPLIAVLIIWSFLFSIVQPIIHEGGHFIFGLLSGLGFLSFRVKKFTLIKVNGKFKIKKYNTLGSAGQCMMTPKKENQNLVLYLLGGVITDAISSILLAWLTFGPLRIPLGARLIISITAIMFIGCVLINGIPRISGGIYTDGYYALAYIKDGQAKKSAYDQLYIPSLLQMGYTYGSLKKETVTVPEGADLTNPLIVNHKLIECYHYMDLRKWDKALECIRMIEEAQAKEYRGKTFKRKIKGNMITILAEKLFIDIKTGKDTPEVEALYARIKKILNTKTRDFNLIRVRMAYDLYLDSSPENRNRIEKELSKMKADYPYKGDADFCTGLIVEMI